MTAEQKECITILKRLGRSDSKPTDKIYGVCHNLPYCLQDTFSNYCSIIKRFKYYSKSDDCPIAHPRIKDPVDAYQRRRGIWTGEYGRRRRMFARFLARELSK